MTSGTERIGTFTTIERMGALAHVRFSRNDKINALSVALMQELQEAATRLAKDTSVHAVVLSGEPVFSGGADLKDPALAGRARMGLLERREALKLGPDMCAAWAALDQVTIAAVEGFCIGGGLALAAACDWRVAGRNAHFRLPEIPLGMNMSWRAVPRLVGLIGPAHTKRLVIMGERLSALEAETWGLIDRLAAEGEALEIALAWAREVALLPPVAVRMAKRAIAEAAGPLDYAVSYMDLDQFALTATGADQAEAVQAFLEKRNPRFTGK